MREPRTSLSTTERPGDPILVDLDDRRAREGRLTGGKASALATARSEGIATVPGFALSTSGVAAVDAGRPVASIDGLRDAWVAIGGDRHPVVVRSSSTVEDQGAESLAGQFATVTDVSGWTEVVAAIEHVLASRSRLRGQAGHEAPFAVLVQPFVQCAAGGVLFGADPVTGRTDRLVVAAVPGPPEQLVGGEVQASEYVLRGNGSVESSSLVPGGARLGRHALRSLARLAAHAESVFGQPQDIEWAIDDEGRLVLLQSRPITSTVAGVPVGPVLGMGPVAETFPEPLRRLEIAMWVPPLRQAIVTALSLAGVASRRELDRSTLITTVRGVVVVDLELFGEAPRRSVPFRRTAARLRHLRASWRVGRLSRALPELDRVLLRRIDSLLGRVPPLHQLTDLQLMALIDRAQDALRSLHGHEILTSLLVDPSSPRLTAGSVALRTLVHARANGASDDEILAEHPVVLSLVPPRIGEPFPLPQDIVAPPLPREDEGSRAAVLREALRLRVRWVQELTVRAVDELAERLTSEGVLAGKEEVTDLGLGALHRLVTGRSLRPEEADEGWHDAASGTGERRTLPARFWLSDRGIPIPVDARTTETSGTGAGGGVGEGPVSFDPDHAPDGGVLVVRTLDPGLVAVLPRLAGLVCETGSVLAHTAILAREAGVATVVGHLGATGRYHEGEWVRVDGTSGVIQRMDGEEAA